MKFLVFMVSLVPFYIYSNGVEVIPDSQNVVKDEVFGVTFKIQSETGSTPEITMDGVGVSILEKENQGVSSTTTYINGRISTKREHIIRYQIKANRTGRLSLSAIKINDGGKIISHPNVYFNSANEPPPTRDIFIKAEPSKTNVYMGEGIVLRYYLYHKVQIANQNIKKFPKLAKFMKRYMQENPFKERIVVDGQSYQRWMLYSTVLYPEKMGELKIDPLVVEVSYPVRRNSSGLGSFGFGVRNYKKKTFSSKTIMVQVNPLPPNPPEGFSGLVGEHDFTLDLGREKFLVNEPVELKLTVVGDGNLENYEAQNFINHKDFEAFENNANLETTNSLRATKKFNITFLPRSNVTLPEEKINLSYFNPATKKYETKIVTRPSITVKGTARKSFVPTANQNKKEEKRQEVAKELTPVGPFLDSLDYPFYKRVQRAVNACLLLCVLLLVGLEFKGKIKWESDDPLIVLLKKVRKSNLKYSDLYLFLDKIDDSRDALHVKIDKSDLSKHAKSYFKNVLNNRENVLYGEGKSLSKVSFKDRYFREALNIIKSREKNKSDEGIQLT